MKFIEAKSQGHPSADELRVQAEEKYAEHPVWTKCVRDLEKGKVPQISRTTKAVCSKCYMKLPSREEQRLKRGEAVVCEYCKCILLFGETRK